MVLVKLNNKNISSKDLGKMADDIGFKHQVLKNALTKLKKLKLVYCVSSTYSINPNIAVATDVKAIELNITANVL